MNNIKSNKTDSTVNKSNNKSLTINFIYEMFPYFLTNLLYLSSSIIRYTIYEIFCHEPSYYNEIFQTHIVSL